MHSGGGKEPGRDDAENPEVPGPAEQLFITSDE